MEDIEVSGHVIPKDKWVIVVYSSANRDAAKFDNPDAFDVTRDVHVHVGFGQGVHICMGMHLARREIILLIEALRRRVARFELTGTPVVAMNSTIRAYGALPVRGHLADIAVLRTAGAVMWSDQRAVPMPLVQRRRGRDPNPSGKFAHLAVSRHRPYNTRSDRHQWCSRGR